MTPRRLSRRSSCVDWTAATHCFSASVTDYFVACVSGECWNVVTGARRCDHITPLLEQLHWLPVCQRIVFKIAGLVHQSLGSAPAYLADVCRLVLDIGCHPLQSNYNDTWKLLVLLAHNKLCDEFLGRQSSTVERPSSQTTEAWTGLWLFPSDNLRNLIYLATEALSDYWICRSYTNKLIYLSICSLC